MQQPTTPIDPNDPLFQAIERAVAAPTSEERARRMLDLFPPGPVEAEPDDFVPPSSALREASIAAAEQIIEQQGTKSEQLRAKQGRLLKILRGR